MLKKAISSVGEEHTKGRRLENLGGSTLVATPRVRLQMWYAMNLSNESPMISIDILRVVIPSLAVCLGPGAFVQLPLSSMVGMIDFKIFLDLEAM
mmetsp:Transcript_17735/g.50562  ORF Transcript_17735/g.50562 Transcript_17735/m.50562 type:complete len:95 (+) Transcript_17735:1934-2218(+)